MAIQPKMSRFMPGYHQQTRTLGIRSSELPSLLEPSTESPGKPREPERLEMVETTVHIPSHIIDEISLIYGLGDVQLDPIPRFGNSYASFCIAANGAELTLRRQKGSALEIGLKHPDIGKRIRAQHGLVSYLHGEGFPVSPPLLTKDRRSYVNVSGVPYSLYPHINGRPMDPTNPSQLAVAGRTLARYHRLTTRYRGDPPASTGPFPDVFEEQLESFRGYAEKLDGLSTDFGLKEGLQSLNDMLPAIHRELRSVPYVDLPKTMIHGNYAPKNILFRDGELVAVIGFGQSRYDARLVDLSITMYRLMKTVKGDWSKFQKLAQEFTTAYNQLWPLQTSETTSLPVITQGMVALRAFKKARKLAENQRDPAGIIRRGRRLSLIVERLRWLRENSEKFNTVFRGSEPDDCSLRPAEAIETMMGNEDR